MHPYFYATIDALARGRAEMFLQDKRHGAAQTSHAVFMRRNQTRWNTTGQNLVMHLSLNHGSEAMPGPRQVSDDNDHFGVEPGDDHAHAASEIVRHRLERLGGTRVALIRKTQEILECQSGGHGTRFEVIPQGRAIRAEYFPTASASATALRSVGIERHVSELARHTAEPARELTVDENAGTETF